MQLKIHIKNDKALLLPMGYNYQLMSAIYHLLGSDEELSGFIHSEGWRSGRSAFKLFTFSPLMGHYLVDGKRLIFDSDISLEVRSPSEEFITAVRTELFENGSFKLFNYELEVRMLECFDKHFDDTQYRIKTVSPIAVRRTMNDGSSVYFSPEDELFDELVNLNLYHKFTAAYQIEPPSTVDLTLASRPKKVVTKIKGTWVTAYHAQFCMHAHPAVARFLYDTGLGERNSQGFGMFDISG